MVRQLAYDVTESDFDEAINYSRLIWDCFGYEPFSLKTLKNALEELSWKQLLCLLNYYDLLADVESEGFHINTLNSARKKLIKLDEEYHFLLSSQIKFLEKERKRIVSSYSYDANIKIEDTTLSPVIKTCLRRAQIFTLKDLESYNYSQLSDIRDLGPKRINEIKLYLSNYNLSLN